MPSPKYMKKDYAIIRDDNTYVVYSLTKSDYEKLEISLMNANPYAKISVGLIGLKDVRSIVEQKPEPKEKKVVQNTSANPDVDVMSLEYIKQQEKMVQEWLMKQEEDELEGGRFN